MNEVEKFWTEKGFERAETGGGCTAMIYCCDDDVEIMVTEEEPMIPERLDEPCIVGIYFEGDEIASQKCSDAADAATLVDKLMKSGIRIHFVAAMVRLADAAHSLHLTWEKMDEVGVGGGARMYPFPKSWDDMVVLIDLWVDDEKMRLVEGA